MKKITERYEAQDLDPLFEGWDIGIGHDMRLERYVVLARLAKYGMRNLELQQWLAKRAAVSHPFVAELLDCEQTDDECICVFEGGKTSRIGLPNLARKTLLTACLHIIEGVSALLDSGTAIRFSGGQVLWDNGGPKVLGLFPAQEAANADEQSLAKHIGLYFGHVLEWNIVSESTESERHEISQIWQIGLQKLQGDSEMECSSFAELRSVVQALAMDEEMMRQETLEEEPLPEKVNPRADVMPPVAIPAVDLPLPAPQAMRFEKKKRNNLLSFSVVAVLLILLVLGGGALIGAHHSSVHKNTASTKRPGGATKVSVGGNPAKPQPVNAPGKGLPSVAGLSPQAAQRKLQQFGVPIKDIQMIAFSATQQYASQEGLVVAMSPQNGSPFAQGEIVSLKVAVPMGEELVPALSGLTLAQAAALLLQDQFHYSYVLQNQPQVQKGIVFSQNPGAYTLAKPGTQVAFAVAAHY